MSANNLHELNSTYVHHFKVWGDFEFFLNVVFIINHLLYLMEFLHRLIFNHFKQICRIT